MSIPGRHHGPPPGRHRCGRVGMPSTGWRLRPLNRSDRRGHGGRDPDQAMAPGDQDLGLRHRGSSVSGQVGTVLYRRSWQPGASSSRPGWLAQLSTAGCPMLPSSGRRSDRGHRRRGELPSDATATHEVHDLGAVSLLPGFIETTSTCTPVATRLPGYRHNRSGGADADRATANMRRCSSRARRPPGTQHRDEVASRFERRSATESRSDSVYWLRGPRSRPRRALLVPRRRGRYDRGGRAARP